MLITNFSIHIVLELQLEKPNLKLSFWPDNEIFVNNPLIPE